MGAEAFVTTANGATPDEAFHNAVQTAQYNYGHAGYTGSIAEKDAFTLIPQDPEASWEMLIDHLFETCDERINDKWGPAGCIHIKENEYVFFGWASS